MECVVLSARGVCPNPPNPTWIHPFPLNRAFEPWWLVLTIDDIDNVLTHVHTNNSLKQRSENIMDEEVIFAELLRLTEQRIPRKQRSDTQQSYPWLLIYA